MRTLCTNCGATVRSATVRLNGTEITLDPSSPTQPATSSANSRWRGTNQLARLRSH
jgi:hypothetical protein